MDVLPPVAWRSQKINCYTLKRLLVQLQHGSATGSIQLFEHQCGQAGISALTHFQMLGNHRDTVISTDAHKGVRGSGGATAAGWQQAREGK